MKNFYYTTTASVVIADTRMFRAMDYLRSVSNKVNKTRLKLLHGNAGDNHGIDKPYIPRGSVVEVEFVCSDGLYCLVDVAGVLRKCLIPLGDLHKLHYPTID